MLAKRMFLLSVGLLASRPALAVDLPNLDGVPIKTGAASANDAAIVIGIEDYLRVPDVPGATADAKLVRDFLVYTRGIPPARVRMLTTGTSREVMLGALQDMGGQVGPGGTLWFYFAGHGGASPSGERLLLGDDVPSVPEALQARSVLMSEVKKYAVSGGGQLMVVVDACFNGSTRTGGSVIESGTRFVVPQAAVVAQKGIAEWSAASPQQLARPLPNGGHGAFTYFWVGSGRGWADGQLDGKRDGNVTAEEAHEYIAQALASVGITQQTPSLTTDAPKTWMLAKGAKEVGPDFAVAIVVPEPQPAYVPVGTASVNTGGAMDFAALAAEAARADADAKAAAERAERSKRALESEREKRLEDARSTLLTKATRDWSAVSPLLSSAGSATRRVVETYISTYGEATVALDDTVIVVPVPQVEEARAWLAKEDRASFAAAASSSSAGSRLTTQVPSGTRVRIEAISTEDAYYASRDGMIGLSCRTDADSNVNGDGWHGGPVTCDNGQDYYFYQAAYSLDDGGTAAPAAIATTAGRRIESDIPAGSRIRIEEISPEDAYYPGSEYVGLDCTAGEGMTHNGAGFHGGPMTCDGGQSFYFYKVAVVAIGTSGSSSSSSGGGRSYAALSSGTRVTIVEIAADDAYYGDRGSIVGQSCVTADATSYNGDGWHGGSINCDNGESYYFYKAALSTGGGGGSAKAGSAQDLGDKVKEGVRVRIADIGPGDAFYEDRDEYIGKTCSVSGDLHRNDGLYYGGGLTCEGSFLYFAGVAVEKR